MNNRITISLAALTFGLAPFGVVMLEGCDDGPVGKAINCRTICSQLNECLPDVDESKCRSDCKDDATDDNAADCADCLDDDSCAECSGRCAGVGLDLLFK